LVDALFHLSVFLDNVVDPLWQLGHLPLQYPLAHGAATLFKRIRLLIKPHVSALARMAGVVGSSATFNSRVRVRRDSPGSTAADFPEGDFPGVCW
jgi:hypothetical protein